MEAKMVSLSESRSQKPPMMTKSIEDRHAIMGSSSAVGTCWVQVWCVDRGEET
jgi:hypothetical protein